MLKPIRPGLRTIHNGSNAVAKAYVIVPSGGELTVPDTVADQLQRDTAFKDGPTPQALLDQAAAAIALADVEPAAPAEFVAGGPVDEPKRAPAKKAPAKRSS